MTAGLNEPVKLVKHLPFLFRKALIDQNDRTEESEKMERNVWIATGWYETLCEIVP